MNGAKREGLIDKYLIDFQNEIEKIHEKIAIINKDERPIILTLLCVKLFYAKKKMNVYYMPFNI